MSVVITSVGFVRFAIKVDCGFKTNSVKSPSLSTDKVRAVVELKSWFSAVKVAFTVPQSTSLYYSLVSHLLSSSSVGLSRAANGSVCASLLEAPTKDIAIVRNN